ncbi:unnamed protein product [Cochlearia groenlandica]
MYKSEGKLHQSSTDLDLCKVFNEKACCSASEITQTASLATYGEAPKDCLNMFDQTDCSICETNVAIQTGPLRICDAVFDAYFSDDAVNQVIFPCGESEGIIGRNGSKLESNGVSFCEELGFNDQTSDDSAEEPCYGSNAMSKIAHLEPSIVSVLLRDCASRQHKVQTAYESAEDTRLGSKGSAEQVKELGGSVNNQTLKWFQDLEQQFLEMKLVGMSSRLLTTVVNKAVLWIRWHNQLLRLRMIQM